MRWTSDVSRYSVEMCAVHLMISCPLMKCIGCSVVSMTRKLDCRLSGNELYLRFSGTPTWNNEKWHIETGFSKMRRVLLSFHVSLIKILGHNRISHTSQYRTTVTNSEQFPLYVSEITLFFLGEFHSNLLKIFTFMDVKAYHVFRTFLVFVIPSRYERNRFRMFWKNSCHP
jgi:hypothetical protein